MLKRFAFRTVCEFLTDFAAALAYQGSMKDEPSRSQHEAIPLPPDRAFVVQLRPPSELDGEIFIGRVEHITSGSAASFDSVEG